MSGVALVTGDVGGFGVEVCRSSPTPT